MARTPRFSVANIACHVSARGVNRTRIFHNGFEKKIYLKGFAKIAIEEGILVHGYCLMDNHVHFLLTPTRDDGLSRLFHRVHTWWAMRFNRKHHRTGHLFQDRYHSSPLDENHYWTALRYIEVNPRRAGIVKNAEDFPFSSALAHLSGTPDPLIDLAPIASRRQFSPQEWRECLAQPDPGADQSLRRADRGSRPCGSASWIQQLEQQYGRRLAWSPPGRPKANTRTQSA